MERKKRLPSGTTSSEDTVLVQVVARWLPPDSPEFRARANRPLSERGPSLALYLEEQKAKSDEPKPSGEQPPAC